LAVGGFVKVLLDPSKLKDLKKETALLAHTGGRYDENLQKKQFHRHHP
jgi:hypothetical protein